MAGLSRGLSLILQLGVFSLAVHGLTVGRNTGSKSSKLEQWPWGGGGGWGGGHHPPAPQHHARQYHAEYEGDHHRNADEQNDPRAAGADGRRRANEVEHQGFGGLFHENVDSGCWTMNLWRKVATNTERCRNEAMSIPDDSQFDAVGEDSVHWNLMSMANHIYMLCTNCTQIRLPNQWKGKISLVDAIKTDECLGSKTEEHNRRITVAHKLLLADAKANNYTSAAIVEDDYQVTPYSNWTSADHDAFTKFFQEGEWESIRPAWRWYAPVYGTATAKTCTKECECSTEAANERLCTIKPGCKDVTSSVAYIVRNTGYDKMLNAGGCIDNQVMGMLKSTLVRPPLIWQPSTSKRDQETEKNFNDHCVKPLVAPPVAP